MYGISRPNGSMRRAIAAAAALFLGPACAGPSDPLEQARQALDDGDADRAYAALDAFLSTGNDSAEAFGLMARACLRTMRTLRGAAAAARAAALGATDPAFHRARACLEQRRFDNLAAIASAEEAVRLAPDDARNHALLGTLFLGGGRIGTAEHEPSERAFRRALELDPALPVARFGLARTLVEAGDPHEAIARLDELLADGFAAADVHYLRGFARGRARDFAGAEEDYRRALAISPMHSAALFNLARALRMVGRNDDATSVQDQYAQALERERALEAAVFAWHTQPDAVAAALDCASLWPSAGHVDDAIRLLDTVCLDHPELAGAHLLRARLAAEIHDDERATESLERALQLAPDEPATRAVAARIEFDREQYVAALAHAEAALVRSPDDLESALVRAHSLIELGRAAEAAALLEPLAQRVPGPRVLAVYARALLDAGLPDRAEAVASAALARRVTAAALTVRGRARAAQSRFGLAKEDLQGASELEPLDPEAYEGMERVLEATGEIDAVSAWRDRADAARARGEELARLRRDLGAAPFDARAGEALAEALVAAGLTAEAALVVHRIRTPELDPCRAW